MRGTHGVATFLIAMFLAGCGHMPITSMVKLARIDFIATDPAQLRAAVKLPHSIAPLPDGVVMRIAVKASDGREESQEFILRQLGDAAEMAVLKGELEKNTHIFAYRLDSEDVTRLRTFRETLQKRQAAAGQKGGSLTISIQPQGCRTAELAYDPLYFTTYLRTGETGSYVPLARDVDLRTLAPGENLASKIPPCSP